MHKKNVKKELERNRRIQELRIRQIILRASFNDKGISELISRSTRIDVMRELKGYFEVYLVPDIEKGEVIIDSRGEGTLQRRDISGVEH